MAIESSIQTPDWDALGFSDLAEQVISDALAVCGLEADLCHVSLLACDDAQIATLNAEFRGKAVPTNVLSWPERDLGAPREGGRPAAPQADFTGEIVLGDIAIAYETCAREAHQMGTSLQAHTSHLLVHGLLHLLGYDHIRDGDAARMEALETKILGTMGLDDPYRDVAGP